MTLIRLNKRVVRYDFKREVESLCKDGQWTPREKNRTDWLVHTETGIHVFPEEWDGVYVEGAPSLSAALHIVQPVIQTIARASAGECVPMYTTLQRFVMDHNPYHAS
jgi:hypothetical protein